MRALTLGYRLVPERPFTCRASTLENSKPLEEIDQPMIGQLMPPRVPTFRKAMAQEDERALALFCDVHPDAIGLNEAMLQPGHWLLTWQSSPNSPDRSTRAIR